jgi:hypothetical protein
MAAKRATIRQGDITRAIKGAKAAGLDPGPVQIKPDGTILIFPRGTQLAVEFDELEQWEAQHRANKT